MNKWTAIRNNRNPDAVLFRSRYVRSDYCGVIMQVWHNARGAYYRCRDQNGCWSHSISARIIDRAVWERVEAGLTRPEIIQVEVMRLSRGDPVKADLEARCRLQARNLNTLRYEGHRFALEALGVVAHA
jgi:hypothetical protein